MYRIYLLLTHLLLPLVVLRQIIIAFRLQEYRAGWRQRFGIVSALPSVNKLIWIHAVSVGEVYAAKPLVEYLQNRYSGHEILITTVTPTGAAIVDNNFKDNVRHSYLPFDIPFFVNKFLDAEKPHVLLVMETEIWPTLYACCHNKNIPIALINARLSEKSLKGYRLIPGLWKTTLACVNLIAAQSKADAERFISLGADESKINVTGNLKFNLSIPQSTLEEAKHISQRFGTRPVLIAASTHEGEEGIIVNAMAKIIKTIPDCLLIIAPRHPVRVSEIQKMCEKKFLKTAAYTDEDVVLEDTQIYLLDILGKLPIYYATADIAFIGGSLVPVGGHNMLEAAALGLPLLSGKYIFNVQEMSELLHSAEALLWVNTADDLASAAIRLFKDPVLRAKMGSSARDVVASNQGNMGNLIRQLEKIMPAC